jgi:probable F420-dependent oxidoreductase
MSAGHRPRLVLVLTENWTIVPPEDPGALSAAANGLMANPREYALPGNQDPATPWPSSIVLLSAIAAATERLRLVAGAIIAPLRHPLLLARDLATLDLVSRGRLVVLPTVSWHEDEYRALGVDFRQRGKLLDEHLAAWTALWRPSPTGYRGDHYSFDDVWLEPKPYRRDGPLLWFGGSSVHPALLRRIVRYGSGFNPLGRMSDDDLAALADAMRAAGRAPTELEMVGGLRGAFPDDDSTADLAKAVEAVPEQVARGFSSFCFKPNQFTDDVAQWGDVCREAVARVGAAVREAGGVAAARAAWAATGGVAR